VRRTLLVTGASRGLGRAVAERALAAGYDVIGVSRKPAEAPFPIHACDVADAAAVKAVASALPRETPLWGVVNAAGVASMNLALMTPPATVSKVIATNLMGAIHVSQAFAPALIRAKAGRIIHFSTIAVPLGLAGEAVYVASKAGVEGFARAFAREVAGFGVTVNCIAPGPIDTDLIAKVPAEAIDRIVRRQVVQRKGTPDDVWNLVAFLLSEESAMISGEVLHLGGA
jgi:3-oxoacyl-[acyl-carrier protein] reductase